MIRITIESTDTLVIEAAELCEEIRQLLLSHSIDVSRMLVEK